MRVGLAIPNMAWTYEHLGLTEDSDYWVTISCLPCVCGGCDGENLSFFVGGSGITITPFYDLVSVVFEASGNQHIDTSLAMAIGDNFDIDAITAFHLLSFLPVGCEAYF